MVRLLDLETKQIILLEAFGVSEDDIKLVVSILNTDYDRDENADSVKKTRYRDGGKRENNQHIKQVINFQTEKAPSTVCSYLRPSNSKAALLFLELSVLNGHSVWSTVLGVA